MVVIGRFSSILTIIFIEFFQTLCIFFLILKQSVDAKTYKITEHIGM